MRVLVLGASGMLGAMVTDVLRRDPDLEVHATVRSESVLPTAGDTAAAVRWSLFDAVDLSRDLSFVTTYDWVVNCIGITKPLIRDDNAGEVQRAIVVNALFPHRLAETTRGSGTRIIQIATDCVYSGARGSYAETEPHDALDAYGKTKSLGEVPSDNFYHLRCSIVGPEPKDHKFLLDWFVRQPQGAEVKGFTNHLWNGVSTLHFGKLCCGIIRASLDVPRVQHVVPSDAVTKCDLLRKFAACFGREDIRIVPTEATPAVDRSLATIRPEVNTRLWEAAGYPQPPTIGQMMEELACYVPLLRWDRGAE